LSVARVFCGDALSFPVAPLSVGGSGSPVRPIAQRESAKRHRPAAGLYDAAAGNRVMRLIEHEQIGSDGQSSEVFAPCNPKPIVISRDMRIFFEVFSHMNFRQSAVFYS